MQEAEGRDVLSRICEKDPRYAAGAYVLVRDALDFTVQMYKRSKSGPRRHVSAAELLEGLRVYTLQEYGPMARTVLATWGIRTTEDIGNVVFNLVESGKLGKTDEDSPEDFANGYDFEETFEKPFAPSRPAPRGRQRPQDAMQDRNSSPCSSASNHEEDGHA